MNVEIIRSQIFKPTIMTDYIARRKIEIRKPSRILRVFEYKKVVYLETLEGFVRGTKEFEMIIVPELQKFEYFDTCKYLDSLDIEFDGKIIKTFHFFCKEL